MVDLLQLQEIVKERLEQDRNVQSITATGNTLEEAVDEAAALLTIPVRRLEYEVTEKGSPGFFGKGKKKWTISAYEKIVIKTETFASSTDTDEEIIEEIIIEDADGDAFIHLTPDGAFLKVISPKGNGRKASVEQALAIIEKRHVSEFDSDLVSRIVSEASGEYVRIGDFEHHSENTSTAVIDVVEAEMKAQISITEPGIGGSDITLEGYKNFLQRSGVVYGIHEDVILSLVDKPLYKERIVVAEGLKPHNGKDSHVLYNFETDQSKVTLKEGRDGRIDFKELNIINNVVEGQPLARKMPPEDGVDGKTVTGKVLPAKKGKDAPLPLGRNVHVGEDGVTIIADMNGQVLLSGGKINVEPIYNVEGDVDLKTGNIVFLGTVIISGNVSDGFSVKAAGNIEVNGSVGKATLDADGDIIVHQGIVGKSSGVVKAGRSIWARFIENAKVESGNMVVASDGIINSHVDAVKRIVCRGKRAHIVGGRLRSSEEINAKILGSPSSGTETICEVGLNPQKKLRLESLIAKGSDLQKQLDEAQLNLQMLINLKKQRQSLPEDKEAQLKELADKRQLLTIDIQQNKAEIVKIQEQVAAITTRGKVSASSKVYPGVKIIIKDAVSDVHTEYKAVTFILEHGLVRVTKYEEPDEESMRSPDGYTTN